MEYHRFMRPWSNLLMPPIPPDILACNPGYGNALNFNACMFAIRQMPRASRSTTAVCYKDSRPSSPKSYELPIQYSDPRRPRVGFFFLFKKNHHPSSKCPGRIVLWLSNFGLGLCTVTIDLGPSPVPTPFRMDLRPEAFYLEATALNQPCLNTGGFITYGLQGFTTQLLHWYSHARKCKLG